MHGLVRILRGGVGFTIGYEAELEKHLLHNFIAAAAGCEKALTIHHREQLLEKLCHLPLIAVLLGEKHPPKLEWVVRRFSVAPGLFETPSR